MPELVDPPPAPLPYTTQYEQDASQVIRSDFISLQKPDSGFFRIAFQLVCSSGDPLKNCSAGIIFGNLKFSEETDGWKGINIRMRGILGNEIVGVRFKEADGFDREVRDIGKFTPELHLQTGDWQTAFIPRDPVLGGLNLQEVVEVTFVVDADDTEDGIVEVDLRDIKVQY